MDPEPDCVAKGRIDAEAQEALDDVGTLLANFQQPEGLRLGLEDIQRLLIEIKSDTHHQ